MAATWLCALSGLALLLPVLSYPGGPPDAMCTLKSQRPSPFVHGFGQSSECPFSVVPQNSTVAQGETVLVNIEAPANRTFKGFFVIAKQPSSGWFSWLSSWSLDGTFIDLPEGTRHVGTCGVSHSSREEKTKTTLSWRPPQDFTGAVEFVATIVQEKSTFWLDVTSLEVTITE